MIKQLERKDIKVENWEYEFQQRNEHPILMADLFCRALYHNLPQALQMPGPGYDYLFTKSNKGYVKTKQKQQVLQHLRDQSGNQQYINYILNTSLGAMTDFDRFVDRLNGNLTDDKLAKLWKQFDTEFCKVIPWFYIPWYISEENILTDKVKLGLTKFKNHVEKITDLNNALMILISPTKKLSFQTEQESFYNLVNIAKIQSTESPEFKTQSEQHLSNYAWTKTFLLLPLDHLTEAELISRVREAIDKDAIKEFELRQNKQNENQIIANQLLDLVSTDKDLILDIERARELGWVLTASVEQNLKSTARCQGFLKTIAEKINVDYPDLKYLLSVEISDALENKTSITPDTIKERAGGHIFMSLSGQESILTGEAGKELSNWVDTTIHQVDTTATEFKGQPACRGQVTGKVKVALNPKDSYDLKDGEILVCSMTSPDYVPAMKRSAAIITDEGGLLCHAAIMSREFNKPCVIATKIATQLLKDGDLVEVDADRGVVTILEK